MYSIRVRLGLQTLAKRDHETLLSWLHACACVTHHVIILLTIIETVNKISPANFSQFHACKYDENGNCFKEDKLNRIEIIL